MQTPTLARKNICPEIKFKSPRSKHLVVAVSKVTVVNKAGSTLHMVQSQSEKKASMKCYLGDLPQRERSLLRKPAQNQLVIDVMFLYETRFSSSIKLSHDISRQLTTINIDSNRTFTREMRWDDTITSFLNYFLSRDRFFTTISRPEIGSGEPLFSPYSCIVCLPSWFRACMNKA